MSDLFVYKHYLSGIKELLELYQLAKTKGLETLSEECGGTSSIGFQMLLGVKVTGCPLCQTPDKHNVGCSLCPWVTAMKDKESCNDYEYDSLDKRIERLNNWLKLPIKEKP